MPLDHRPADDFRSTLATASAVFDRSDFKYVSGDLGEEPPLVAWTGSFSRNATHGRDEAERDILPSRGRADTRSCVTGWDADSSMLVMDVGPHGAANCAHAHADALAVDASLVGQPVLVDGGDVHLHGIAPVAQLLSGRFRAQHSRGRRNFTVGAGRTVRLGGGCGTPDVKTWYSHEWFDFISASHDGRVSARAPASHQRSVLFVKSGILRSFSTVCELWGRHDLDLSYHFPIGTQLRLLEDGVQLLSEDRSIATVPSFPGQQRGVECGPRGRLGLPSVRYEGTRPHSASPYDGWR